MGSMEACVTDPNVNHCTASNENRHSRVNEFLDSTSAGYIRRHSISSHESSYDGCSSQSDYPTSNVNEVTAIDNAIDFRCKQMDGRPVVYEAGQEVEPEQDGIGDQASDVQDNSDNRASVPHSYLMLKASQAEVSACCTEENLGQLVLKFRTCLKDSSAQAISVKQLRHVIPLLIMATFDCRPEPMLKKVKGMWTSPPDGWPADVPFCDPNNGQKVLGKPRKEVLMKMFTYLINLYAEMYDVAPGESFAEGSGNLKKSPPMPRFFSDKQTPETGRTRGLSPRHTDVRFGDPKDNSFSIDNNQSYEMNSSEENSIPKLIPISVAVEEYVQRLTGSSANARSTGTTAWNQSPRPGSSCNAQFCANGFCSHRASPRGIQTSQGRDFPSHIPRAASDFFAASNVLQKAPTLHSLLTSKPDQAYSLKRSESFPNYNDTKKPCNLNSHIIENNANYFKEDNFVDLTIPQETLKIGTKSQTCTETRPTRGLHSERTVHKSGDRVVSGQLADKEHHALPAESCGCKNNPLSGRFRTVQRSISEQIQLDSVDLLHTTISSKLEQVLKEDDAADKCNEKVYVTKKSRIFEKMNSNEDRGADSSCDGGEQEEGEDNAFSVRAGAFHDEMTTQSAEDDVERASSEPLLSTCDVTRHYVPRKRTYSDCSVILPTIPSCSAMNYEATSFKSHEIQGQLIQRLTEKIRSIEDNCLMSPLETPLVKSVFDVLRRTDLRNCGIRWLKTAHAYESSLDAILMFQQVPDGFVTQWKNYRVACLLHGTDSVEIQHQLHINKAT